MSGQAPPAAVAQAQEGGMSVSFLSFSRKPHADPNSPWSSPRSKESPSSSQCNSSWANSWERKMQLQVMATAPLFPPSQTPAKSHLSSLVPIPSPKAQSTTRSRNALHQCILLIPLSISPSSSLPPSCHNPLQRSIQKEECSMK
jgi:hypothetical protein